MQKFFQTYWTIGFTVITVMISIAAQWSLFGYRLTSVEQRQDRQGEAITAIQNTLTAQASEYAALNATINAISDNVDYIRSQVEKIN